MLIIIPRKYRFETTLVPKRVARKLDGELTEFRPNLNVLATGKFMKSHNFGKYEKSEHGTLITGTFRKGVSTYIFGIIWAVLTLLSGLVCLSLKQEYGAVACAVLFVAGMFFLFWDNKIKYLYSYLDGFPRYEEKNDAPSVSE